MCNNGITQFYLPPTHKPHLPLLPSHKASPPFDRYSLHLPTKGWPDGMGGWLHTKINVRHQELNPDMVTHPSTNRDWCRLTSPIETNARPPRQTTRPCITQSLLHETLWHAIRDAFRYLWQKVGKCMNFKPVGSVELLVVLTVWVNGRYHSQCSSRTLDQAIN